MNSMGRAGILVKKLAESESIANHSQVIGFNEGPKKNGKVVTLHFQNGGSSAYTEDELFEKNGLQDLNHVIPTGESVSIFDKSKLS